MPLTPATTSARVSASRTSPLPPSVTRASPSSRSPARSMWRPPPPSQGAHLGGRRTRAEGGRRPARGDVPGLDRPRRARRRAQACAGERWRSAPRGHQLAHPPDAGDHPARLGLRGLPRRRRCVQLTSRLRVLDLLERNHRERPDRARSDARTRHVRVHPLVVLQEVRREDGDALQPKDDVPRVASGARHLEGLEVVDPGAARALPHHRGDVLQGRRTAGPRPASAAARHVRPRRPRR